ncbi:MAG TPA: hypothetical protein VGD78_13400 [Chthoniobacterales bacterium]
MSITAVLLAVAAREEIEDIRPPILFDPVWAAIMGLIGLVLAVLLTYLLWPNPRPKAVPPADPHQVARARLGRLESQLPQLSAYAVSIEASDLLRQYLTNRYGLRATQQTTPEFLHAILPHPSFTPPWRDLLEQFLGTCDQIKFARVDPGREASEHLVKQARAFIDQVS